MSLPIILLAAQAAGIAMDLYGSKQAAKSMKTGYMLDAANAEKNIEQLRLQSTEDALFGLTQLQRNLSTQRAISGARGQASFMGSAKASGMASERAFTADERARELSLRFKTFDIKSDLAAGKLANMAQRRQIGQGFMNRAMQQMSTNQFTSGVEALSKKLNTPQGGKL
jgi:hypothetical protein